MAGNVALPTQWLTLEVHDTTDADAIGGNPITTEDGTVVGRATSGGYGFRLEKSLALAMVRPDLAIPGTKLKIDILDQRLPTFTVLKESPLILTICSFVHRLKARCSRGNGR